MQKARKVRPIVFKDGFAIVPLTKGYEAIVDATDAPQIAKYNWHVIVTKHTVYAARSITIRSKGYSGVVLMHRVLLGSPGGVDVDHKDGDGLNNRRSNLREATRSQNNCNARVTSANKSGIKGVSWDVQTHKWRATARTNGKSKCLGRFDSIEDAKMARESYTKELHGEFFNTGTLHA